jgi:hypothetical protein
MKKRSSVSIDFIILGALASSTAKIFTGGDLDQTQKITSGLLLYVVNMGVDVRLLALASQAGPDEIRWITPQEARDLRVVYQPLSYKPWRIEPYHGGAIAISESNDGLKNVVAGCSIATEIERLVAADEPSVHCGGHTCRRNHHYPKILRRSLV